ncbi:hypothetical protein [Nocardioides litoris]|uniref:hypothetical protein n=1 Tax=Nocardioides litoris TaxID=1926648 RepID=UPI0014772C91|nr:hypothetical protein [Nocardioides litoris]
MSGPSTLRAQDHAGDVLTRSLGPTAPAPFGVPGADLGALVDREDPRGWRWVLGTGDRTVRRYPVPAATPSYGELAVRTAGHGRLAPATWSGVLAQVGAALARLHALPAPDHPPPALARLADFLDARPVDPARRRRRDRFVDALGPDMLAGLRADCRAALRPATAVLSHGWAGLGTWFATGPGAAVGVVGEDHGAAAPEHDLGAVLGQVVELAHLVPWFAEVCPVAEARARLLAGYGRPVDQDRLDREVRLAITRHVADYAVHTRLREADLATYAALVVSL